MKKILLLIPLFFVSILFFGCGKSSNELLGSWKGLTDGSSREYQIETTFNFKNDGNLEYSNEFGIKSSGTYEINENKVTIKLEIWDESKVYEFKVEDDKLALTATDVYSPSYSEMIKE